MPTASTLEKRPVSTEHLVYEIDVTAPGTRSQGWHGTLYNENGQVVDVDVGKTVTTDIGVLVSVAAGPPWKPYGLIPQTPGMDNNIMPDQWSYKLFKSGAESTASSWRGELLRGPVAVEPQTNGEPVPTAMGPFIWSSDHGWAHKSWNVQVLPYD